MKYAELHYFADPRLVIDGFSLFVWRYADDDTITDLPMFKNGFGAALEIDSDPGMLERFNPDIGTWAAPLPLDYVLGLRPYTQAIWDGEIWIMPSHE